VLRGVHKHGGLLRAGIASAANDYRLGANEAPPAIISVFMGEQLNKILDEIENGTSSNFSSEESVLKLGVSKLPEVMKDYTDRNRTSPFAFTGNKFEFRAVGSSSNPSFPVTLLNAAVADGISEVIEALKAKGANGKKPDSAVWDVMREFIKNSKAIRFEGNGYSEEWVKEAERRGLPNLRKTPEALKQLVTPETKKLFTSLKVFSEQEMESRYVIRLEAYIKRVMIEVEMMRNLVETVVLPAAYSYHGSLATSAMHAKSAGVSAPQIETLNKLSQLISQVQARKTQFDGLAHKVETLSTEDAKAKFISLEVNPMMADLRGLCDQIEDSIADEFWPLPKYREMLFLA
jgi:glutamine synthetase